MLSSSEWVLIGKSIGVTSNCCPVFCDGTALFARFRRNVSRSHVLIGFSQSVVEASASFTPPINIWVPAFPEKKYFAEVSHRERLAMDQAPLDCGKMNAS